MQSATKFSVIGACGALAVGLSNYLGGNASAVVVQVNGAIIPNCADNIVYALARGELAGNATATCNNTAFPSQTPACWSQATTVANCTGPTIPDNAGNAGSQGPINAVNDASQNPQVFVIPKVPGAGNTTVFGTITATFLWRNTAGYRNSFGWYNVGDDVTVLTNLHAIMPSWPPPLPAGHATVLNTDPAYDQAGQGAPFQTTVDFQAMFTAGTYKGGFVGFYLMTPEGQAGASGGNNYDGCSQQGHARGYYPYFNFNAGATGTAPAANSCVGYMYFTEAALNGDGNYVHSLIYQTKVLDTNKVRYPYYYFTFEDTYRSSDIGYSDNTLFVQGLATPCIPTPETCNGLDDDCDGVVDNNPSDAGGTCTQIPGNKPGVGICTAGTEVCRLPTAQGGVVGTPGHGSNDQLFCDGEIGPGTESCNGVDDDCDGKVDDPAGVTDPTKQVWGSTTGTTPLPNQCAQLLGSCKGSTECVNGAPQCVQTSAPSPEKCNGNDDDCDGIIDDNPADVGLPCYPPGGTIQGICKAGVTECLPGNDPSDTLQCEGWIGPKPTETCNGLDDNCNGLVDDNPVDVGPNFPCTPTGVTGVCTPGYLVCVNGAKVCTNFGFGKPETCNGIDDDCDGIIDNDYPVDSNVPCGSAVGACKQGLLVCRLPDAKGGVPGTTGHSPGDTLICDGATGPMAEQCDGIDNDCNGVVDDGPDGTPNSLPGVGVDCSTQCGKGKTICKDGVIQCNGTTGGTVETCNGKDDDCNGIIDDHPIDAGGQCGTVVINPAIQQNPDCALGVYVCRPPAPPGVPGTPGNDPTDQLFCDGENHGTTETCNGIDDDCNGVVDDNVPGQGTVDCAPAGLTLPLKGECRPGKLYCIGGVMTCQGGIGPQAQVCDGKDHNCDGTLDTGPCPNPDECIRGACRQPCPSGEFSFCSGGTECSHGYCVPPDCTGKCGAGLVCDIVNGDCESGDGGVVTTTPDSGTGTSGTGGSIATGTGGSSGTGVGGTGTMADGGGALSGSSGTDGGAMASNGGSSGNGTGTTTPGTTNPSTDPYGLATGGGGCACRTAPARHSSAPLLASALLGLVVLRRRSRRGNGEGRAL